MDCSSARLSSDTKKAKSQAAQCWAAKQTGQGSAGVQRRKYFTFWPMEKAGDETRKDEGAKESKI